jgi:hypothetical protein
MAQFMIDIILPQEPNTEFFALIPLQRAHIDKLLEQGTVMAYSLSFDRSRLWIIVNAPNQTEALEILSKFPMIRYFEPTMYPLAFHNTTQMVPMKVSLN